MNEYNKKYWKKVYMYFGNDLVAWWHDTTKFHEEYHQPEIDSISKFPQYFDTNESVWKFTDKFLEEVMTW